MSPPRFKRTQSIAAPGGPSIPECQIPDIDLKPAQQFQDLAVRETLGPLDLPPPPQRLGQQSGRAQVGPRQVENQPAPSICFAEPGRRTAPPEQAVRVPTNPPDGPLRMLQHQ